MQRYFPSPYSHVTLSLLLHPSRSVPASMAENCPHVRCTSLHGDARRALACLLLAEPGACLQGDASLSHTRP